jgi:hypothetical protein
LLSWVRVANRRFLSEALEQDRPALHDAGARACRTEVVDTGMKSRCKIYCAGA